MTADRTLNSHAAILAPTATSVPPTPPPRPHTTPPYPVCPTLCAWPPRPRPCSCCVRQDCGEREVPSSDENSGHHWASICKVVETGSCASDDDCTGSRHCTRSTNPDEDFVCSGDSGCEQVCASPFSCACPSVPAQTTHHPSPYPVCPSPCALPRAPQTCAAAACGRTGPPRPW